MKHPFRYLNSSTFEGLTSVNYLNLADNVLGRVPNHLWKKMPSIKTLDMGRTGIRQLTDDSFRVLYYLYYLKQVNIKIIFVGFEIFANASLAW